ncbi:hypothetical protein EJB05_36599 [Eragrostis curvula]|uniref:Uncharacterized protein n=1 Tax=Eragrostis curvula TaxID=38414 RepID=A0A5J9U9I0_9POAL|nr:hypothetical protein EJB05_36599 [Eragrostis curvula]
MPNGANDQPSVIQEARASSTRRRGRGSASQWKERRQRQWRSWTPDRRTPSCPGTSMASARGASGCSSMVITDAQASTRRHAAPQD